MLRVLRPVEQSGGKVMRTIRAIGIAILALATPCCAQQTEWQAHIQVETQWLYQLSERLELSA